MRLIALIVNSLVMINSKCFVFCYFCSKKVLSGKHFMTRVGKIELLEALILFTNNAIRPFFTVFIRVLH